MAYESPEKFKSTQLMLGNLKTFTGSSKSAETYLSGLKRFMALTHTEDLDVLIDKIKGGEADPDDIYEEFHELLAAAGYAPKSRMVWLAALSKLFSRNKVPLKQSHRLNNRPIHATVLPDRATMIKILNHADVRQRAAILILLSSGLRIGELVTLKLGDVDMSRKNPMIRLRAENTKGRKPRVTFMSYQAKGELEAFLNKRRELGHDLGPNAPVISTWTGTPMNLDNIYHSLKAVFRLVVTKDTVGKMPWLSVHPHVFRHYFKSKLYNNGVPAPLVDMMAGHARYMPMYNHADEVELAAAYDKGVEALIITEGQAQSIDVKEAKYEMAMAMLKDAGFTMRDLQKRMGLKEGGFDEGLGGGVSLKRSTNMLGDAKEFAVQTAFEMIGEKIRGVTVRKCIVREDTPEGGRDKVIPESEIGDYLDQGFHFIALI
jgi:integrase